MGCMLELPSEQFLSARVMAHGSATQPPRSQPKVSLKARPVQVPLTQQPLGLWGSKVSLFADALQVEQFWGHSELQSCPIHSAMPDSQLSLAFSESTCELPMWFPLAGQLIGKRRCFPRCRVLVGQPERSTLRRRWEVLPKASQGISLLSHNKRHPLQCETRVPKNHRSKHYQPRR